MMSDSISPQSEDKSIARSTIDNYDEPTEAISGQLRIIDFEEGMKQYNATFVNIEVN